MQIHHQDRRQRRFTRKARAKKNADEKATEEMQLMAHAHVPHAIEAINWMMPLQYKSHVTNHSRWAWKYRLKVSGQSDRLGWSGRHFEHKYVPSNIGHQASGACRSCGPKQRSDIPIAFKTKLQWEERSATVRKQRFHFGLKHKYRGGDEVIHTFTSLE